MYVYVPILFIIKKLKPGNSIKSLGCLFLLPIKATQFFFTSDCQSGTNWKQDILEKIFPPQIS
jgi:hypothetical protein